MIPQKSSTRIDFGLLRKHPENSELVPALTLEEREGLRDSFRERGFDAIPFIVCESGLEYLILDGNSRYDVLIEEYGGVDGSIYCINRGKLSIDEQRTEIENASLRRRNLSYDQKAEIARRQVGRGVKQKDIAENLGVSRQWVSKQTKEVREKKKQEQDSKIRELMDEGYSQREISEKTGLSRDVVRDRWGKMLTDNISPQKDLKENKNLKQKKEEVKRLRDQGYSARETAQKMGVSPQTILNREVSKNIPRNIFRHQNFEEEQNTTKNDSQKIKNGSNAEESNQDEKRTTRKEYYEYLESHPYLPKIPYEQLYDKDGRKYTTEELVKNAESGDISDSGNIFVPDYSNDVLDRAMEKYEKEESVEKQVIKIQELQLTAHIEGIDPGSVTIVFDGSNSIYKLLRDEVEGSLFLFRSRNPF